MTKAVGKTKSGQAAKWNVAFGRLPDRLLVSNCFLLLLLRTPCCGVRQTGSSAKQLRGRVVPDQLSLVFELSGSRLPRKVKVSQVGGRSICWRLDLTFVLLAQMGCRRVMNTCAFVGNTYS